MMRRVGDWHVARGRQGEWEGQRDDKWTLTRLVASNIGPGLLLLCAAALLDNVPQRYVNRGVREEGKGVGGKWMWVIYAFMRQNTRELLLAARALTRSFPAIR